MHGFGNPRQRGKKVFSLLRGSGPHSWRVKVFGMDIDLVDFRATKTQRRKGN
jgi:hypothetical protein